MIIGFMVFLVIRALGELLLSNLKLQIVYRFLYRFDRTVGELFRWLDLLVMLDHDWYRGLISHYLLPSVL